MAEKLTSENLKALSKEDLIRQLLSMQDELEKVSDRLDYLTEQIAIANTWRFGRHTEKLSEMAGQGCFDEVGNIYFNEAEALLDANPNPEEPELETVVRKHTPRPKGKKETDLSAFPVVSGAFFDVSEDELIREFGSLDDCKRMPDKIYRRLLYIPAGWKVEESRSAVYRSRSDSSHFAQAKTPDYLLRGSIVSPSLEAAIINAKFANAMPYRRIEKDFAQQGVYLSEQNMASWTIKCSDRYLSRVWNYLHGILLSHRILQADETTCDVSKDGRRAGRKSYMWVYRTGAYEPEHPIVLYDYQKTRQLEHPMRFLNGFQGYLVCDGFSGYKALEKQYPGIRIAECWAHARRYFSDAVKATGSSPKVRLAADALKMIGAIYSAENKLKSLPPEERCKRRNRDVRPLVDAFFSWVREKAADQTILMSNQTMRGMNYCLNQEEALRTFLEDGEIPIDNNRTEGTIRGFTIGRKNWMMIDTVSGARASAVIYSLVETAKANNLNIYHYIEYLLTELPKLKEFSSEEEEAEAMERLLPWSESLPENCHKRGR